MVPLSPVVIIPDLVEAVVLELHVLRLWSQMKFLVQIWGWGRGERVVGRGVPEQTTLAAFDWLQRLELLTRQEQSERVGSPPLHE